MLLEVLAGGGENSHMAYMYIISLTCCWRCWLVEGQQSEQSHGIHVHHIFNMLLEVLAGGGGEQSHGIHVHHIFNMLLEVLAGGGDNSHMAYMYIISLTCCWRCWLVEETTVTWHTCTSYPSRRLCLGCHNTLSPARTPRLP